MKTIDRPDARRRRTGAESKRRDLRLAAMSNGAPDDRFFGQIVKSMRNGVLAFHRDGRLALMNDEAYRSFGLIRDDGDVGRPFTEVLRDVPDAVRVLSAA